VQNQEEEGNGVEKSLLRYPGPRGEEDRDYCWIRGLAQVHHPLQLEELVAECVFESVQQTECGRVKIACRSSEIALPVAYNPIDQRPEQEVV
jgi:hypothetical protein